MTLRVPPDETDTDRSATYDFLSVFNSNMGLSCIVSEIKSDICKILQPRVLNVPAKGGGVPLEFYNGYGAKKLELCPYQTVKKFEFTSIRLDTILALDRQTDRP